jgi:hypothetical protein
MKATWLSVLLVALLGCALGAIACGGDDDAASDGDTDTDTDTSTDTGTHGDGQIGEFCDMNEDCESFFCDGYQHVPMDPDGECAEALPEGQVRVQGNVRDFLTGEYKSGVEVKIGGAMSVLQNPTGYTPITTLTTDADARFETDLEVSGETVPVGMVATVEATGYFLSVTGLAEPELEGGFYPPGIRNHDVKLIPLSLLDDWSDLLLEADSSLSAFLPLGTKGGVLGSIRHVETGDGVEGAHLVSQNDSSNARIFYLNEAQDGFGTTETSPNGFFVIFDPSLAEKFDAVKGGEIISRLPCTVGQTLQAQYSTTVHVEGYSE